MTFPAQSPDLRRFPLVAGASRSVARSPRSAAPRIRFLFVDSRVRFTLRSAHASRRTPCASLRSLRPSSERTFTSRSSPMPGPPPAGARPREPAGPRSNAGSAHPGRLAPTAAKPRAPVGFPSRRPGLILEPVLSRPGRTAGWSIHPKRTQSESSRERSQPLGIHLNLALGLSNEVGPPYTFTCRNYQAGPRQAPNFHSLG